MMENCGHCTYSSRVADEVLLAVGGQVWEHPVCLALVVHGVGVDAVLGRQPGQLVQAVGGPGHVHEVGLGSTRQAQHQARNPRHHAHT